MNNKKKMCTVLVVGCVLLTLLAVVFTGSFAKATPAQHLKVGVVMPISGPISTVGMAWVRDGTLKVDSKLGLGKGL